MSSICLFYRRFISRVCQKFQSLHLCCVTMTIYHVLSIYIWVHLLNGENISLLMGTTLKFWMEESFNNKTTQFPTRVNVNISIKSWNNNNRNCVKEKGGWFFICSCSWLSKFLMSRESNIHVRLNSSNT